MANPEHLKILMDALAQGDIEVWNRWVKRNALNAQIDLTGIDLQDADLADIDLYGTDLSEANLERANLARAKLNLFEFVEYLSDLNRNQNTPTKEYILPDTNLRNANLYGANLTRADLVYVNLNGADLSGANLERANLAYSDLTNTNLYTAKLGSANLSNAVLKNTNFTWIHLNRTIFSSVDLSQVVGIETAIHNGPSTIGIDTLYQSGGKIPREFLEGCGVPESMIAFSKSLVGQAIEFYSCFISYSSKDEDFCKRLVERMKSEGLRVWFAPEEMKGGRKIYDQIDEAIRLHDKLIVVLSEHSMNSAWVKRELINARKREKAERRQVLFPVSLVSYDTLQAWELITSDGDDLAEEIRLYYIPDFSNWKDHDSFSREFDKLLKGLRQS